MLKYADAYLRYSDKNQDELSIEYQQKETQEYADRQGIIIKNWYIDRAHSAKKVAGRDEFYRYIETVRNGTAAPYFLVWRTNRAFRNSYESHIYRKLIREKGIRLMSATQQIDEDTSSGRLVTNILSDIDQYKSEEIGDHVIAASRTLVKRNPRAYMGQLPIFGYKVIPWKDGDANRFEYAINDDEKDVVIQIFDDFINGKSLYQIAAWLNENGYVTRRNKKWSYQTLNWTIKNDFYKGVRTYQRHSADPIIIPGGVPAIISPETWDRAQRSFRKSYPGAGGAAPRRQKNGTVYPLTGKMYCSHCGATMCGKRGGTYKYYVCINMEHRRNCPCKRLRKEAIEGYILRQIKQHFLFPEVSAELTRLVMKEIEKMPKAKDSRETLEKQKEKLVLDMAGLVQMKLDGELQPEVYAVMNKQKNDELIEIEKKPIYAGDGETSLTEADIAKKVDDLILSAQQATVENGETIKALFDQVVKRVEVSNASVTVTLALFLPYFSHKLVKGSPIIKLCEKAEMRDIKPIDKRLK